MASLFMGLWNIVKSNLGPIKNFFVRPLLRCTYMSTEEPFIGNPDHPRFRAAFYRLDVTNDGHERAKECQGFLDLVKSAKQSPAYGPNLLKKPEQLKWAHEDAFISVSIDPRKNPRKLDLFHVYETNPLTMHLPVKPPQIPVGTRSSIPTDAYLFDVRIDYDSDRFIIVSILIKPSDKFDGFAVYVHTEPGIPH
jgi:hypothetical protein